MSIPASMAISKLRIPELDEPVTRGRIIVDRGEENEKDAPVNALHAFAKGAVFGLMVAGQILCNVLTVLSLVATINGLLTWIGRGFGIHQLTLQLVLRYVFYPITFFMGTYMLYVHPRTRRFSLIVTQVYRALRSCASRSSSRPNSSKTNSLRTWTCRRSWHPATRSRRADLQSRRMHSVDSRISDRSGFRLACSRPLHLRAHVLLRVSDLAL